MDNKISDSEYIRKKYKQIVCKFERVKDEPIINHLESMKNITDYIRTLINEDLKHGKETEQI